MGGLLREVQDPPLCEELVCLVEEFLFSRAVSCGTSHMMIAAVRESDLDCITHLFTRSGCDVIFLDEDLAKEMFYRVPSDLVLKWLLSFGEPPFYGGMIWVIEWYYLHGLKDLLKCLLTSIRYPDARASLGSVIHDLSYCNGIEYGTPGQNPACPESEEAFDPIDPVLLVSGDAEELRKARSECMKILYDYSLW